MPDDAVPALLRLAGQVQTVAHVWEAHGWLCFYGGVAVGVLGCLAVAVVAIALRRPS